MQKTILLATLALAGIVNAGTTMGTCPAPVLQQNFDAVKYMGLWYEQARDKTMPWESNDCQQARYTLNKDGTVGVFNTQYNPATDKVEGANATATFNGAQGSVKFFWYAPAGDYRVLATDYENYAIVYSCTDLLLAKSEYIWILTRERDAAEAYIYNALNILKEKIPEYDQTYIRRTSHASTCKYWGDSAVSAQ